MSSLPGGGKAPAPKPIEDVEGEEEPWTEPEVAEETPPEQVVEEPEIAQEDPLTGELAEVPIPDERVTLPEPSEDGDERAALGASTSRLSTFADLDDHAQLMEVLENLQWGLPPSSFDEHLKIRVRGPSRWDEVLAWMASKEECVRYDWTATYEGWSAFQLAAREGCGDALANMHVNCIDKSAASLGGSGADGSIPIHVAKNAANPNAAPWDFVVDSVSPDGCNMLHLIAIGWANLSNASLPEVTKLGRRVIDRMSPEQIGSAQERVGTPLHAAAAAEVARLNEAARAAREAVTAAEAVVQPVMEASIASALVVVADAEEDTKENGEAPAAPTTTPAGFEMKGSNPLFEDSIDASMDVDA